MAVFLPRRTLTLSSPSFSAMRRRPPSFPRIAQQQPRAANFCTHRRVGEPITLQAVRCYRWQQIHICPFGVTVGLVVSQRPRGSLRSMLALNVQQRRGFHSSQKAQGAPIIWLAGLLKSSSMLGITQLVGRISMTLFPFVFLKNKITRALKKKLPADEYPKFAANNAKYVKRLQYMNICMWALFIAPAALFWATILASLERTPLTGRLRLILLSPEEEEEIARDLRGMGWYNAVAEILSVTSPNGIPRIIPPSDWRTQWVANTMRKLESVIPFLQAEHLIQPDLLADYNGTAGQDDILLPPPSPYPLVPRPRASQILHYNPYGGDLSPEHEHVAPHTLLGPPYSLLVVERPDSANAFSYGFGPEGGGGVVVYSGFIDEVMKSSAPQTQAVQPQSSLSSLWSALTGAGSRSSSTPTRADPIPTEQQTSELAILLAHELSHLLLSHHLETLSSGTILLPSVFSIISDVLRTLLFPVTMILGPFVNDGISHLGRIGTGEIAKKGEACASYKMEIEADVVSARLLAYAGFDPRAAVRFWESRQEAACSDGKTPDNTSKPGRGEPGNVLGSSHPVSQERVQKLKEELARWENAPVDKKKRSIPPPPRRPPLSDTASS